MWFAGSTLAHALSLPRVRAICTPHVAPADRGLAEHRIREASALLGRAGQASGTGVVAALGDILAVAAPLETRPPPEVVPAVRGRRRP
ncbi:hypothetical protein ACIQK5_18730 [Streptomyces virginiae]|uniref:hypothetical protein n=1 Tax=Streptomyces TaxID=1883 RepID=UPI00136E4F5F|nr:hypothetical protein [Streptomyces sp. SID1046]MYV80041.1 hypothetical protein [Streptomyces sp. SID1046]